MPNKIDENDWLYRKVNPRHCDNDTLSSDAFDDLHDKQSFNLVSISSPPSTLEKFAKDARKKCKKQPGDPNPTYLEMYDAGYRVVVVSVRAIRELQLNFFSENDNEYNPVTTHVNVINAKSKAELLLDHPDTHLLNRDETISGSRPPVTIANPSSPSETNKSDTSSLFNP